LKYLFFKGNETQLSGYVILTFLRKFNGLFACKDISDFHISIARFDIITFITFVD